MKTRFIRFVYLVLFNVVFLGFMLVCQPLFCNLVVKTFQEMYRGIIEMVSVLRCFFG